MNNCPKIAPTLENRDELMRQMPSVEESITIVLLKARDAVLEHFRADLSLRNLTEQQWRVMRVLAEESDLDASTICRRSAIKMPSLSRIFKSLEIAEIVERHKDPRDARRSVFALTEHGRDLYFGMLPVSIETYARIHAAFGAERLHRLCESLNELRLVANSLPHRNQDLDGEMQKGNAHDLQDC